MIRRSKSKYGNRKVEIDGMTFDSKLEGKVYQHLKLLLERGVISGLQIHPRWEIQPKLTEQYIKHLKTKDKLCERTVLQPIHYTADFSFEYKGEFCVIDVKGSKFAISADFPLRVKMLKYRYGLDVRIVYKISDLDWIV